MNFGAADSQLRSSWGSLNGITGVWENLSLFRGANVSPRCSLGAHSKFALDNDPQLYLMSVPTKRSVAGWGGKSWVKSSRSNRNGSWWS